MIKGCRPEIAIHLFGSVLRFRGEIVVGVVSLSDTTEQHSHNACEKADTNSNLTSASLNVQ